MPRKAKIGQKVYIPKYEQFGEVVEIWDGRITKVAVQTPEGEKEIDTTLLEVIFAKVVQSVADWLIKLFNKLIRKKKKL